MKTATLSWVGTGDVTGPVTVRGLPGHAEIAAPVGPLVGATQTVPVPGAWACGRYAGTPKTATRRINGNNSLRTLVSKPS